MRKSAILMIAVVCFFTGPYAAYAENINPVSTPVPRSSNG